MKRAALIATVLVVAVGALAVAIPSCLIAAERSGGLQTVREFSKSVASAQRRSLPNTKAQVTHVSEKIKVSNSRQSAYSRLLAAGMILSLAGLLAVAAMVLSRLVRYWRAAPPRAPAPFSTQEQTRMAVFIVGLMVVLISVMMLRTAGAERETQRTQIDSLLRQAMRDDLSVAECQAVTGQLTGLQIELFATIRQALLAHFVLSAGMIVWGAGACAYLLLPAARKA